MTADERAETESRADRALRRGDLSTALSLYQAVAASFPQDAAVQGKLSRIRETLQPMELSNAKAQASQEPVAAPSNGIEIAEAHASRGEYAEAVSIYRRMLGARPNSDLIKERLAELFQLAQAVAPKSEPISSPRLLSDLLDQISRRRRDRPPKG